MCRVLSLKDSLFAVLASLYMLAVPVAQAQSGQHVLITQNVEESKLVTLSGNTRAEARAKYDRGRVPDDFAMDHMLLQLKRSPEQERELQQLIAELTDKSSLNFHRWVTAQEFGERFGLAKKDRDTIKRWLQSHNLKVNVDYPSGILIDFSGTAGQVREAFHTEIHQLEVKGEKHFANMSDPRIPAALAPAVVGVVSLHDFKPHTMYRPRSNYTAVIDESTYYLVGPGDLATIYNLNPLFSAAISGQGQTVVVIEDTDVFTTGDWTTFRSVFGLSSYADGSFTQVHPAPPSGTNNCSDPGSNADDGEAILDAEYASAAAPSAAIVLASCTDTATFGGLIALQNLLNESSTPPEIFSMSYGECEALNGATSNAAFNSAFQQAVTEGVSAFVSSGDDAAAGCDRDATNATHGIGITGWGSSPYAVSVGGTDYGDTFAGTNSTYWNVANSSTYESAKSYIDEIPWNDSCASGLIAEVFGYSQTYGTSGFCSSSTASTDGLLNTTGGSGGPSACATGTPSISGVVSGTCAGWPKPSWQALVGNPSDGVRDIPDVSLFAANGIWGHFYPYCWSDTANGGVACSGAPVNWSGAGGTSFSSPIMAGIQALVDQKAGGRQGPVNPVYYSLAASEYGASGDSSCNSTLGNAVSSSCIFYDVTQGDMDVNCTGTHDCYLPSGAVGVLSTSDSAYDPAYATQTGWDFATGIGTVNAYNLVSSWPASGPTVTVSPTSLMWGTTVVGVTTGTKTVTVTNTGTSTLNISSIATNGDFAQQVVAASCGSSLAAGENCVVDVTFTPTRSGMRTGRLTITDNGTGSPQMVALSGMGSPQAMLTTQDAIFPVQVVGTSSPAKVFTLSNKLSVTLNSIRISTRGDFSVSTTSCTTSLAADSQCEISVVFTPTTKGKRMGSLIVNDSAVNSPETSTLIGVGK